MQIHNNRGELIGEINVIIRPDGGTVTTKWLCPNSHQLSVNLDEVCCQIPGETENV